LPDERINMNNILLRKAMESDLPIIEKLITELIESMDNKEGIDTNTAFENCRNLLSDTNSYLLVGEINGAIIGFIHFAIHKALLHSGPSGLIDEFIVTRSCRSKGVGKQLIDAATQKCKQLGCCEVEVSTEFANTTAREFYKSCGFEERGVILEKDLL